MDIETILQKLGYKRVFKKDGTLSVNGNKAYGKILDLLYNLTDVGVITPTELNKIIDRFDKAVD